MILFTPGPVMMDPRVIAAGAIQIPNFRTPEFSALLLRAEKSLLELLNAPEGSRVAFITGSGTAAMEAALLNFTDAFDDVAIIDGGKFGHRFAEICECHRIRNQRVIVDRDPLTDGRALGRISLPIQALCVTGHETSIGHLYDLPATGAFARANDALHIVDAISLFGTDELDMTASNIDVLILSSNKGLALAPGVAMLVISPLGLSRLVKQSRSYYMDVRTLLADGARGQTTFTPAIGTFLQLDARLSRLSKYMLKLECFGARDLARYFREGVADLKLEFIRSTCRTP